VPNWGKNSATFYLRTVADSAGAYNLIRSEVKGLDAAMPVYEMKTVEGQLDETLLTDRLIAMLSAGFGLLATLLASIGLYGVMAFATTRRTSEFGLRMALGASKGTILRMVIREGAVPAVSGMVLGVLGAGAVTRLLGTVLFEVQPYDPLTYAAGLVFLSLVTFAACYIPASRASSIDPLTALRVD
jgi:ABC-type antimicrobial peptide transport system permease subunit